MRHKKRTRLIEILPALMISIKKKVPFFQSLEIAIFTMGYITSQSDRLGRKFLIYLTLIPIMVTQLLILYMAHPSTTLGTGWLYADALFIGALGGGLLLDPGLMSYVGKLKVATRWIAFELGHKKNTSNKHRINSGLHATRRKEFGHWIRPGRSFCRNDCWPYAGHDFDQADRRYGYCARDFACDLNSPLLVHLYPARIHARTNRRRAW